MCSLYLGDQIISGQTTLVGESRNIGQIIPSTIPLTDAGLHLLDGSLIQGSGIYSAFVDYIAGLDLTANYFCTEAEWQASVTQYGVCGKFVYDSVNNTVRLPKVTGIIEGTTDVSALGDLVEAGLPPIPQHTHSPLYIGGSNADLGDPGAYLISAPSEYNGIRTNSVGYTGNASTVTGGVYGNSTTVQPQTIKAFYYIVIATSTKTDIQVDIDEIATDLNGKVDKSDLQEVQFVVETYVNGTSWYRVWSDGWCEQGGYYSGNIWNSGNGVNCNFIKTFINTNYHVNITMVFPSPNDRAPNAQPFIKSKSTTSVNIGNYQANPGMSGYYWQACGYIGV